MQVYFVTAVVNFLTFISLSKITGNVTNLQSAIFIFSMSIGLEALSLKLDSNAENSFIIQICIYILTLICIMGCLLSFCTLSKYIELEFKIINKTTALTLSVPEQSLLPFYSTDITNLFLLGCLTTVLIFCILMTRIIIIQRIRKTYNLSNGFFGK